MIPSSRVALTLALVVAACSGDDATPVPAQPIAGANGVSNSATAAGSGGAAGAPRPDAGGIGQAGIGAAGSSASGTGGAKPPAPMPDAAVNADDAGQADSDAAVSGSTASFADSFEQGASLDPARYETVSASCSGTGRASLDATAAHGGSHSLRIDGGGGYCNHVFVRAKLPAALPAPLYVRVFVKLMAPLAAGHTTFAAMHDMREDKDLRLGGQNEVLVWNRESDDATLPELSPTGVMLSAAIPAGAWHCLEWSVDAGRRAISTWLDDKPIAGLTLDAEPTPDVDRQWLRKTDWQPQLIDVRLGWESYGDQANTLWFDDLAIGPARLGCAP